MKLDKRRETSSERTTRIRKEGEEALQRMISKVDKWNNLSTRYIWIKQSIDYYIKPKNIDDYDRNFKMADLCGIIFINENDVNI